MAQASKAFQVKCLYTLYVLRPALPQARTRRVAWPTSEPLQPGGAMPHDSLTGVVPLEPTAKLHLHGLE